MKKLNSSIPFLLLGLFSIIGIFVPIYVDFDGSKAYNFADVSWMLISSALVLLMTPGLSFFYGGMVGKKNVISTMMQSFIATGLISVLWIVVGFGLAFGKSLNGFIGDPREFFMMHGINAHGPWSLAPTIPILLFALFQMKFAIITPALVVGATAERIRFSSYILFMILFSLFIYSPIAHWNWHPDGFLAGAIMLKRRKVHITKEEVKPARIPYVLLGTGLLWFGWFGFNAGSAVAANGLAVNAFANTNTASATAALSWIFFDTLRGRKPSALGFCIGAVVGLVAVTPAAGYVGLPQSMFIGFIAAICSNIAVYWKGKTTIDDTLDVFPCHGIGGIVGMVLTGVFASKKINPAIGSDGLIYGGTQFFLHQVLGCLIVVVFATVMGFILFKIVDLILPIRVSAQEEETGLDLTQHDEKL